MRSYTPRYVVLALCLIMYIDTEKPVDLSWFVRSLPRPDRLCRGSANSMQVVFISQIYLINTLLLVAEKLESRSKILCSSRLTAYFKATAVRKRDGARGSRFSVPIWYDPVAPSSEPHVRDVIRSLKSRLQPLFDLKASKCPYTTSSFSLVVLQVP